MSRDPIPLQVGALDRLEWRVKQACESLGVPVPERQHIQEYAQLRMMEEAFRSWRDKECRLAQERQTEETGAREDERKREIKQIFAWKLRSLFDAHDIYYDIDDHRFREKFAAKNEKRIGEIAAAQCALLREEIERRIDELATAYLKASDETPPEVGDPDGQPGQEES